MAAVRQMPAETSSFHVLSPQLMAAATEEFPQQLPVPKSPAKGKSRSRRPREARFKTQPVTFAEIAEVEEEGSSPLEEERARRSFLQSLENLRRSTQALYCPAATNRTPTPTQASLDSSDSDSTQWGVQHACLLAPVFLHWTLDGGPTKVNQACLPAVMP